MAEAYENKPTSRIMIGDQAPLSMYLREIENGELISIPQICAKDNSKSTLFVFLRHFNCMFSREHIRELENTPAILDQLNVVIVSNFEKDAIKEWKQKVNTTLPMYMDPELDLYKIMGFSETANTKAKTFFKAIILSMKTRSIPQRSGRDTPGHLGGNMIVDKEGKVTYLYRSESPDDRPLPYDILKSLR
ncbi:Thioredoxin-like protein AAED1 [Oopsacas minuta]|uniref:Thioredoxin-like protein AAED1 n=1 Tax=Oopsacas minuta TaxID=111878 RepID=A0AAV7JW76_9METZ|nr:Thioredoxin-like protein AAED1 [Oopsacas minuta]